MVDYSLFALSIYILIYSALGFLKPINGATITVKENITIGDVICASGYIMDYFCILRGTLFDNPTLSTLGPNGPKEHSVHCLIDVPVCVNSPFEILNEVNNSNVTNSNNDEEIRYGRAWRVSKNDLIVEYARKVGVCDDGCQGVQKKGLKATIIGEVLDLGNSETPSLIKPIAVVDSDVGCGNIEYKVPNLVV